jgi:hypothetical protein
MVVAAKDDLRFLPPPASALAASTPAEAWGTVDREIRERV